MSGEGLGKTKSDEVGSMAGMEIFRRKYIFMKEDNFRDECIIYL